MHLLHFCERKPIPFQVRASLTSNLVFKKIIVVGFSPKSLARLNCTQKTSKTKVNAVNKDIVFFFTTVRFF